MDKNTQAENYMRRPKRYSDTRHPAPHRKKRFPELGLLLVICCIILFGGIFAVSRIHSPSISVTEPQVPETTAPILTEPPLPPTARQKIMNCAAQNNLPFSAYPESIVELLEHNPEAEDFVLQYPVRKKIPLDLSKYDPRSGVPLFIQWDPMWGYEKYGSDVMGITGCGPTCLAMVGFYLTSDPWYNPIEIAAFAEANGYYIEGSGSSWSLISEGAEKLGFTVTEIPLDENRILANLDVGNPIICVVGPGDFTTEGHFLVLVRNIGGKIQVNDPNSPIRSGKLWDYDKLAPQFQNLWVIQK